MTAQTPREALQDRLRDFARTDAELADSMRLADAYAAAAQEQPAPEARHWDGAVNQATRLIDWILAAGGTARYHDGPSAIAINAPDCRTLTAVPGDWIVRQPDGTFRVLVEDTRAALAALRSGIAGLAADLDRSAAETRPSRKSEIESECAIALRRLLETP